MKFLLDTQVFLWFLSDRRRFSAEARAFLEDTGSKQFFLSDVSIWEGSIKYGLGKLELPEAPELFFPDRVRRAGYKHLAIDLRHVARVHMVAQLHRDPFDRLLITQALLEDMTIISDDRIFREYDVDLLSIRDIS